MRLSDLTAMAAKDIKTKWTVLICIGLAIAVFCLCFASAVGAEVTEEKAKPYELVAEKWTGNGITSDDIAKIDKLENVNAATSVLQVPATIQTGQYSTQMTLMGIDAAYIDSDFERGDNFPDNSVMPYIVLNEAACKLILDQTQDAEDTQSPDEEKSDWQSIDWTNLNCAIVLDEDSRPVTAKVCGILKDTDGEETEPAAYISLASAKDLLIVTGMSAQYHTANVKIANSSWMAQVSNKLGKMGLTVTNNDEMLQQSLDSKTGEMTYLILIAILMLFCSVVFMGLWRKTTRLEQEELWTLLEWNGMKSSVVNALFVIRAGIVSLMGVSIGTITVLMLPAFLSIENEGVSIFLLSPPSGIMISVIIVCLLILPMTSIRRRL